MSLLRDLKPGDKVTRMLAGTIPMKMEVLEVSDTIIKCGALDCPGADWEFDRATGAEVDELLNWGPPPKMTGSFLRL